MAFTSEAPRVPTSIGDINITITDFKTGNDEVNYAVQIRDASDKVIKVKRGNLVPHLSAAQIAQLQNIAADIRTKAQVLIP